MAPTPTFRQRIQYFFDNFMSRGTIALIGGLGVLSLVVIFIAATIISLGGRTLAPEGSGPLTFIEAAWESLMRTFDAGTMGGGRRLGLPAGHALCDGGRHLRRQHAHRCVDRRSGRENG